MSDRCKRQGRTRRLHAVGPARARSRSARRCCRPRARSASTSIRSAAGAACAAAARCCSRKASSRSTASPRAPSTCRRSAPVEQEYCRHQPMAPGRRLSCSTLRAGRPRHRRAVRQPGAPAGRAQGGRSARHRARSGRPAALRRGAAARHARSFRRSAPARGCARLRMAADRPRRATCACCSSCSRRCARAAGR